MDKFPMMMFKAPGPEFFHGFSVGLKFENALNEEDLKAAKEQGWHETTTEAVAAFERERDAAKNMNSNDPKPSRAELEVKATELGVKFTEFTTDDELAAAIVLKLEA
jgi:hypothetical protein